MIRILLYSGQQRYHALSYPQFLSLHTNVKLLAVKPTSRLFVLFQNHVKTYYTILGPACKVLVCFSSPPIHPAENHRTCTVINNKLKFYYSCLLFLNIQNCCSADSISNFAPYMCRRKPEFALTLPRASSPSTLYLSFSLLASWSSWKRPITHFEALIDILETSSLMKSGG